eukprot:TRINITY_DN68483_c0_g1_i1.p1 TRINITY_DN68483_c0_g1~~TRINITY_DN68483_c0_g1_i1.p1  ORF type:complete len:130 (-),score=43.37 TRINITY_DN68483_c0_g1_i1:128-478(-)
MATYDYAMVRDGLAEHRIVLIDVRNPKEVSEEGKIPGSHNVPVAEVEEAFKLPADQFEKKYGFPLPDKEEKNIVTHCMKGGRALRAKEALKSLGYVFASDYPGSFTDWKQKGGKLA